MMDELREMARAPVAIFDRFLGELQRVTRDKTISAPVGIERLKDLQASMVREIEESLQKFRSKVGEVERRLHGILRPARPPLYEEIKQVTQRLQHLLGLAIQREQLLRSWEDQPPEAVVEGYRAALSRHEVERAELYEAEAERVLLRKGNAAALQTFLSLRIQAEESRLDPVQKQAKADLKEIERLKHEVTLSTRVVASTLKVSGGIAAAGAGWRSGGRLRLEPQRQSRTAVLILPDAHPGMTAQLVDVSRTGMRLALPQELPPGAVLNFIVRTPDGRDGEVRMQAEVRWCRADGRAPGRFLAGVRLLRRPDDQWFSLLRRLAEVQRDGVVVLDANEA